MTYTLIAYRYQDYAEFLDEYGLDRAKLIERVATLRAEPDKYDKWQEIMWFVEPDPDSIDHSIEAEVSARVVVLKRYMAEQKEAKQLAAKETQAQAILASERATYEALKKKFEQGLS